MAGVEHFDRVSFSTRKGNNLLLAVAGSRLCFLHAESGALLGSPAYLAPEHTAPGTELSVRVVGDLRPARVLGEAIYDPSSSRLRM